MGPPVVGWGGVCWAGVGWDAGSTESGFKLNGLSNPEAGWEAALAVVLEGFCGPGGARWS